MTMANNRITDLAATARRSKQQNNAEFNALIQVRRISYILLAFVFGAVISKPSFLFSSGPLTTKTTSDKIAARNTNTQPNEETIQNNDNSKLFIPKKVDPGWDTEGWRLYNNKVASLSKTGTMNTTVYPPGATGTFAVSTDTPGNQGFWQKVQRGGWERQTFWVFNTYINSNTTVVDFGTWIGPTLLYHGQYSRRSFGIEADPVAFAIAQYNVELNQKNNYPWANRVSIDSACISRPDDVGNMTMRGAKAPGASMSGIGKKLARKQNGQWTVRCYTLSDIFDNYWGIQKPYEDVFVKVDIESYECKLIPTFYDWLKDERYLPKMYISTHKEIDFCEDDQWEGILKFLQLYDHVKLDGVNNWQILKNATGGDLKEMMTYKTEIIAHQDHHILGTNEMPVMG